MQTDAVHQTARKDVYQIVTNKIIEQLQKGTVPWRQPWTDAGLPRNLLTGRPYKGINLILLAAHGYAQNVFLTYNQVNKELNGKVKKGEEGHIVVYWDVKEKDVEGSNEKGKSVVLKYYTVFNVDQCEGLNIDAVPANTFEPIHTAENILQDMHIQPEIRMKENRAFYEPLKDYINMPKPERFESNTAYYSTLFHELIHWTGHHSRLARPDLIQMSEFGSPEYSNEELTAEIGSAFLQALCGIENQQEQSASYIEGWLKRLKSDKRCLFTASSNAQRAVEFILNVQEIETEQVEEVR